MGRNKAPSIPAIPNKGKVMTNVLLYITDDGIWETADLCSGLHLVDSQGYEELCDGQVSDGELSPLQSPDVLSMLHGAAESMSKHDPENFNLILIQDFLKEL